jgi:tetratricopeptide (TPR) repeat protein
MGYSLGQAYFAAHQFDKAIETFQKMIVEEPNFGRAHTGLAIAYWGSHQYAKAIQEYKTGAELEGDKTAAAFAAALDSGFRSGGWPGALRNAAEALIARRKANAGYVSPFRIAGLRMAQHGIPGT